MYLQSLWLNLEPSTRRTALKPLDTAAFNSLTGNQTEKNPECVYDLQVVAMVNFILFGISVRM